MGNSGSSPGGSPTLGCHRDTHNRSGGDCSPTLMDISDSVPSLMHRRTSDFLALLPIELAAKVAQFLDEPDIQQVRLVCRAWNEVANSELVWKHLTQLRWPTLARTPAMVHSWRDAHKIVWLGSRIANRDGAREGVNYFAAYGFIAARPSITEEADLLHSCRSLEPRTIGTHLAESVVEENDQMRSELMDAFMRRQNYRDVFLPEAMRRLFAKARFPGHSSLSIAPVLRYFVGQYIRDNPGGAPGTNRPCLPDGDERRNIHTLCYAIILLSVDLYNDNVKCKMTRREFIRNNAFMAYSDEYLMRIYDNVYMWGHIAEPKRTSPRHELGRRNIERLF